MFPVKENDFVRIEDKFVARIRSELNIHARVNGLNDDLPIAIEILHIERDGQLLRERSQNRMILNFVRRRVLVGFELFEFERFGQVQIFTRNRRSPAHELFVIDRDVNVAPLRFIRSRHLFDDLETFLNQFHFHNLIAEKTWERIPMHEVSRERTAVSPKARVRKAIHIELLQDDHERDDRSVRDELELLKCLNRIARLHVVSSCLLVAGNPFRPFGLIGLDTHLKTDHQIGNSEEYQKMTVLSTVDPFSVDFLSFSGTICIIVSL